MDQKTLVDEIATELFSNHWSPCSQRGLEVIAETVGDSPRYPWAILSLVRDRIKDLELQEMEADQIAQLSAQMSIQELD